MSVSASAGIRCLVARADATSTFSNSNLKSLLWRTEGDFVGVPRATDMAEDEEGDGVGDIARRAGVFCDPRSDPVALDLEGVVVRPKLDAGRPGELVAPSVLI